MKCLSFRRTAEELDLIEQNQDRENRIAVQNFNTSSSRDRDYLSAQARPDKNKHTSSISEFSVQ